ncbi:MAG: hypothetical protein ABEN55_02415, partial [Bradymonadaceae bacterium]
FDVIPRSVDKWLDGRRRFADTDDADERRDNPIWFVERDRVDAGEDLGLASDITYSTLLNLVSALHTDDREVVKSYILDYDPAAEQDEEMLDELIDGALQYYEDFVLPTKEYEAPPESRPSANSGSFWSTTRATIPKPFRMPPMTSAKRATPTSAIGLRHCTGCSSARTKDRGWEVSSTCLAWKKPSRRWINASRVRRSLWPL